MGYYSGKLIGMQAEVVSSIPTDYILRYDFNGDVLDKSANALNGIKTGTATYDTGRKAGTQCLKFSAGCVKTPNILPIGTNKLTISMWLKTTSQNISIIMEHSVNYNNYADTFQINFQSTGVWECNDRATALSGDFNCQQGIKINTGSWFHIVAVIDRDLGIELNTKLTTNNVQGNTRLQSMTGDPVNNYSNNILFIGQRNASLLPFIGSLQDIRIYNRVLTTEEITALYNE